MNENNTETKPMDNTTHTEDCICAWCEVERQNAEMTATEELMARCKELERACNEARLEAIKWQDAWMNETPLETMGSTLMPWMVGWNDTSEIKS